MPDYSQFVRLFGTALPAPTSNCPGVLAPAAGDAHGGPTHVESAAHTRLADATWRLLVAADSGAKEGGKPANSGGGGYASSSAAAQQAPSSTLGSAAPVIIVGRTLVSTEDRWRIQAAMRREEAKSGLARKEYNKKVTRAIKVTKGPSGDGFPAGRGRPV